MIEPYAFVRVVTIALGATWSVTGLLRALRTARAWRESLRPLAFDDRWWRRQVALAVLRTTVLDPFNVALACVLLGLWSIPI